MTLCHLCLSGKGSIPVTLPMSLSFVLLVLNFVTNLLSIARITADLNYQAIFYSHNYFFQDLVKRKMIDNGSLRDGLYYLDS
jgi:hypothetical protein